MENLEDLDQLIVGYENQAKETKNYGLDKEERKKKKFTITSSEEKFRFIKNTTTGKYFEEVFYHDVRVGKYNQKIYCLHNDDLDCPLCKKSEEILAKQIQGKYSELTEAQKEHNKKYYKDAMEYAAKKYYIFEGIDRGVEKDGKKIWMIKENKKKEGILDKLIPAIKSYKTTQGKDFTDIEHGVDMTITSVQDVIKTSNQKYWKVTSITPNGKPTPLHNDENTANRYLKDMTTWKDVYPPYEITDVVDKVEMVKLISEQNTPYWDEEKKIFIFPNRKDLQDLYTKTRTESKENKKPRDLDTDNTDIIANIINNDSDSLEKDLDIIKKSNDADISRNFEEDFDDLPF